MVLPSALLVKRIQRVTTDHGKELGIRLPTGSGDLRDGDILAVADDNIIVISVLPTDVLVIGPRTIHEMGVVAHSLGNRHLQAQFFDAAIRVRGRSHGVRIRPHRRGLPDRASASPTTGKSGSCRCLSAMLNTRTSTVAFGCVAGGVRGGFGG